MDFHDHSNQCAEYRNYASGGLALHDWLCCFFLRCQVIFLGPYRWLGK
jgi:hypothetical protein